MENTATRSQEEVGQIVLKCGESEGNPGKQEEDGQIVWKCGESEGNPGKQEKRMVR